MDNAYSLKEKSTKMTFQILTSIPQTQRACNFVKEILLYLKSHIDSHTFMIGDFNTPLSIMNRSSREKLNRELLALKDIISQIHLTDIYRTFLEDTKEYTIFSVPQGPFCKIDHILCDKVSLRRHQKMKMTPCILSDHHRSKLDFNNNRNNRKFTKSWK